MEDAVLWELGFDWECVLSDRVMERSGERRSNILL